MVNLPEEFEMKMKKLLGSEYEEFLASYDHPRNFGLRVNVDKISLKEFEKIAPFHLTKIPWTENGYYYEEQDMPARHPFYYAGMYYLQEPSAMTPASRLVSKPGDRVLDLCAAPGGKSIHAAQKLKGTGLVVSRDISEEKTALIRENQQRMKIQNMEVSEGDARIFCEEDKEVYDVVLADLPCSGLGIMGKKPDIRYHAKKEGLESLKALQREILKNAVSYVKPGGILLYSTCTINQGENEENAYEIWCIEDLLEWSKNYSQYKSSYIKLCRNLNFQSELSYADILSFVISSSS